MRKRGVAFAAALATVAVGLSACGDSEEGKPVAGAASESTTAPAPTSSTSAGAAETSATPGGDTGAASQEITPPGTELKIGETATVPHTFGGSEGTIAITVTGIEKGEEADLADFGEDAKGLVPYFIRFKVENVDGSDLSFSLVTLSAVASDGRHTGVLVTGDVEGKCENTSAGDDFKTVGASYESCSLQASRPGLEVTGAAYDRDEYADDPVVWTE
ncbi:hypothetical protein [Saccharomonospora viridis]|jgi:hypothetical protein|uniref:hypothetical protein n=1 Tax=Saccharomonospora viridis TaxID=1852 RepID=UPI002409FCCE|nr:hypothetical protein [Saccharomonospora viridis]